VPRDEALGEAVLEGLSVSGPRSNRYHNRIDFYARVVGQWIPDRTASILVVGGGQNDADVFSAAGFRNVTFTNLVPPEVFTQGPFTTVAADAESLPFPDGAYDYAVAHAVLHHCRSPHRALLELYRVAGRAAIAFEARDSTVMRFAARIGAGNPYEVSAVEANGGTAGGVRDTGVPNYVYRWTEREVEKTIASFAPHARHRISYAYGFGTPCDADPSRWRRLVRSVAGLGYRAVATLLPKQRNLFAFCIEKPVLPRDLQPWIIETEAGLRYRYQ
jgi:SAM-dependent methyltransferase